MPESGVVSLKLLIELIATVCDARRVGTGARYCVVKEPEVAS